MSCSASNLDLDVLTTSCLYRTTGAPAAMALMLGTMAITYTTLPDALTALRTGLPSETQLQSLTLEEHSAS